MFWNTTAQLMVIGTAAFCISFSVIYTLIYCYKSRRKRTSEETEILRDELLQHKFANERSPSLTSPPSVQPVINPNYNASPLRVPNRHLRSTSASYSPTHYLSPHHRRNSTPTHSACQTSLCSCPYEHEYYHVPKSPKSTCSTLSVSSSSSIQSVSTSSLSPNINIRSTSQNNNKGTSQASHNKSSKPKPIPSKLVSANSWDNQKSFSFGPIPPRKSLRGRHRNENEKQPLIASQPEKFALEDNDSSEWETKKNQKCMPQSKSNDSSNIVMSNHKRKHYTPDLFSKEHIVLEEIPYYTEAVVSCHN